MKLDELLARSGALVDLGWTARTVEWKDDDAEAVSFSVIVKNEMTAADQEFIYLGLGDARLRSGKPKDQEEVSVLSRRVHRMIRMGDDNETIPLPVAERMKPSLLMAMVNVIDATETVPETTEEAAKN